MKRKRQANADVRRLASRPAIPGAPRFVDLSFARFADLMRSEKSYGERCEVDLARELLADTGWTGPRRESGAEAWKSLLPLETALEERGRTIAQALSAAEWLWYLRRSTWLWDGLNRLSTTAPYIGSVAEAISAWSDKPASPHETTGGFGYPIEREAARAVFRMRAVACLLYDVHSALRWAGKGADVESVAGKIPGGAGEAGLKRYVRLYDQRMTHEMASGVLAKAGLYVSRAERPRDEAETAAMVPFVGPAGHGRYGLDLMPLGRVPLLADARVPASLRWPQRLLDLVALAWATGMSESMHAKLGAGLVQFAGTGYRVMHRTHALNELDKAIWVQSAVRLGGAIPEGVSFGSADEVLQRLTEAPVSVWPPTNGPPIRLAHDRFLIVDLMATSFRMVDALARPPVTGSLVNVWGHAFERSVQVAIDETAWKPSPGMAALRGRQLRRGGVALTDIDAIGERGGTLLLVSCKSVPYSEGFDRGEHREVRNFASNVAAAVAAWRERVDDLVANPVGDNYDLRAARRIIGVVIYPRTPWTTEEAPLQEVRGGLRAASSAHELVAWCRRSKW